MICTDSRKLGIIAYLIKENDDAILKKVENLLKISYASSSDRSKDFSNKLTREEIEDFDKNINEGCGQINGDDWK